MGCRPDGCTAWAPNRKWWRFGGPAVEEELKECGQTRAKSGAGTNSSAAAESMLKAEMPTGMEMESTRCEFSRLDPRNAENAREDWVDRFCAQKDETSSKGERKRGAAAENISLHEWKTTTRHRL